MSEASLVTSEIEKIIAAKQVAVEDFIRDVNESLNSGELQRILEQLSGGKSSVNYAVSQISLELAHIQKRTDLAH